MDYTILRVENYADERTAFSWRSYRKKPQTLVAAWKRYSIEVVLRKALWHRGFRYRKNYKGLPGRPDIVLTKYRIAIFCDSEFFHGKDWEILKPRLEKGKNPDYWVRKKIERNIQRDEEKDQQLNFMGWTVIHFWGKDILKDTEQCVRVIEETIFDQKLEEVDDEEEM